VDRQQEHGNGDMPSADYYRAKARECLVLAKSVKSPEAAETLWMLAHDYLALASHASEGEQRDNEDEPKH
jgi:hypothetical protein